MKNLLLFLMVLSIHNYNAQTPCSGGMAGSYPCNGLDLQAFLPASSFGALEVQDSWGWTDSDGNGKEYAILALDNGTAFVDISNPVSPVYLARLNTHTGSSYWRDVKVYNNHVYIVSDSNGSHGVQIFDLTRLRALDGTPVVTYAKNQVDGRYDGVGSAHNLIINEDTGYLYILGSNQASGGPVVLNLNVDPENPTLVASISTYGYCHDAQVVVYDGPDPNYQGKELLIGSFSGSDYLRILDVTDKNSISQISFVGYTDKFYTHQGWFTDDKRFFIVGDELDEISKGFNTRTLVFDLQDLTNPNLYYTYYGATSAIDHNGYVKGNRFYLANYSAGARILKISGLYDQIPSMTEVSYFDTFPAESGNSFDATWNFYPFFESGNLIATGFGDEYINGDGGLFILRDPNFDNTPPNIICQSPTIYLDPVTGTATIDETDLDNGSTDDFGIVDWTVTGQTTFTCADAGQSFNITLEGEDDYGNKASCVATVTIAGTPTAYTVGGWSAGTPGPGSNAKISHDYNTATEGSIDACTCEIDATKTLTIAADNYLNITKDITVNGSLIVEHTGSVVQTDGLADVTNNGTINVQLTTPVLQTRDFMIMGSPMDSETRYGVFNDAFLVLDHTPANFDPHPGVPPGGTNFADDNGDFWSAYTGNIDVGRGYIVRPQTGYTDPANHPYYMTYAQGTLNNGDVTKAIEFNGLGTNPDGTPNVLANPYASAISGYDLIFDNPLINEIYFWEHLTPPSSGTPGAGNINFSMDDISMYNLTGGTKAANDPGTSTVPNGVISTGQGFGIKAFAAGNIAFSNSMRLTSGNTTLRAPNENEIDRIWLNVSNAEYMMGSSTLVAFNPLATPLRDPGYDSNRLATAIAIYSHLDDGSEQLGIQTIGAFDDSAKISLGFASQVDAEISFILSLEQVEGLNMENTTIFISDNDQNVVHNLSKGSYEFKSEMGTFNQRFTLFFEQEDILGPDSNILKAIAVYPNPTTGIINVHSPKAAILGIDIYDIRGRRVVEILDKEENNYLLDLSPLETAIYFIKVYTDSGSITKKVIKD